MAESKGLKVGDTAPKFTALDQAGNTIALSDYTGKKAVVLYFYPKDDTPGCTAEACAFRDAYEDFMDAGAEVIGVSADSAKSHEAFISKHRLPFKLLVDEGGKLRRTYGVPSTMGLLPGRVTYVIDKNGVIQHIFNSQLDAVRHVKEALTTLRAAK